MFTVGQVQEITVRYIIRWVLRPGIEFCNWLWHLCYSDHCWGLISNEI